MSRDRPDLTFGRGNSPSGALPAVITCPSSPTNESLPFTAAGTYFKTSDLTYGGTLGTGVISLSHSSSAAEVVALASNGGFSWSAPMQYPSVLKRYVGPMLMPAVDVQLPIIAGQPTYGLWVFHAADDKWVLIRQTGSNQVQASGVEYLLVVR